MVINVKFFKRYIKSVYACKYVDIFEYIINVKTSVIKVKFYTDDKSEDFDSVEINMLDLLAFLSK